METAIGSVEKTLRKTGASCLDPSLHEPLQAILSQLMAVKTYVEKFIHGMSDWKTFDLQTDIQKLIASAQKHEAVFQLNLRTFAPV